MANSFVENVNHVASLDTQYGLALALSKNNILLPAGFTYGFTATFEIYDRRTMLSNTVNATGMTMQLLLLDLKTKTEAAYPITVVQSVTSIGTGSVAISLTATLAANNIDYYLKLVTINVTSNTVSKYVIKSKTTSPVEILPRVSLLTAETVAAMLPVIDHVLDIAIVSDNIALVDAVSNGMPNINTAIANIPAINTVNTNMPSINTVNTNINDVIDVAASIVEVDSVATNMAKVTNLDTNMAKISNVDANMAIVSNVNTNMATLTTVNNMQSDIDTVVLTVVPNIAEILLADNNAATATAQASASSASAIASANSAFDSLTSATSSSSSATAASNSAAAALASQTSASGSAIAASSSATSSSNSASDASESATMAEAHKNAASVSATASQASAVNALASQTASASSAATASTKATESLNSSVLANKWADNAHNLPVSGTIGVDAKYSSYHWAVEASINTVSDIIRDDLTTLTTTWSSTKLAPILSGKSDVAHTHADVYEPLVGAKGTAFNKDFAGSGVLDSVAKSDHTHSGVYEPVITTKNSAFNKNIGTTADTVAAGDHVHADLYMPLETFQSAYNKPFVVDINAPLSTEIPRGNHGHVATGVSYNSTGNRLITSSTVQGALAELDANASVFSTAEKCYMTADMTDPSYVVNIVTQNVPVTIPAGMTILNSNNTLYSNGIIIDYAVTPDKLIQGEFFSTVTIGMVANTKFSLIPLINGVVATQFNIGSSVGSDTSSLVGNVQISANGFISGLNNGDILSLALVNNSSAVDATIYGMTISFAGQPEGAVVASGLSIAHNDITGRDNAAQHPTTSIYDTATGKALSILLNEKADLVPLPTLDNLVTMDAAGELTNSGVSKASVLNKMDKVAAPVVDTIVVMDASGNSKKGSNLIADLALKGGSTANKFLVMDATLSTQAVSKGQMDALSSVYSTISTMSAHTAASNPHNITPVLIGAAPTSHTHDIANVTNLQAALDAKYLKVVAPTTGNLVMFEAGGTLKDGGAPYAHPTGDGNLHVPATGTVNNGKVLMAGATAGSASWQTPNPGTVTSVSGTAPVSVATGTTTPVISMAAATAAVNGYMTNTYASKLDGIASGAQVNVATDLTATPGTTAGPTINSSTGADVVIPSASGTESGIVTTGAQTFAGTKTFGAINATDVVLSGNLTVNGTTTTVNSTTVSVDDINIELGSVTTPTDTTANGGGITLKGATDKTLNWLSSNASWNSSENINLVTGKTIKINSVDILSATTLGSSVVTSSLTSVGTIASGVWNGTTIAVSKGGTGTTTSTGTAGTAVVLATSPTLVTPNIGVATGTSFNSITGLASVAPLAPAVTAVVGTSALTARQDHVHPTNFTVTATDIKMDGVQSLGTLTTFPRADHVHPSDTSKANLATSVQKDSSTGAAYLPVGTTAQRPVAPTNGYMRYNTDLISVEVYSNGAWGSVGGGAAGGGADTVFVETSYNVTQNYTLTTGKSAMTVGDTNGNVSIADGVTITIPTGSQWNILGA